MKIQGPNHSNFNPYQKHLQKQEDIKKSDSLKEDKLQISKEAIKMQENDRVNPNRQNRVEEIKRQVQSGEYNIDPKTTAKKMLDFWNQRT